MSSIIREITPLTQNDCFTTFFRIKKEFNFPLHFHDEFELNFIFNAKGAKRIVGNQIEEIDDIELVLIGPNVSHAWFTHNCKSGLIHETTIQFHQDLFDEKFLNRNQLSFMKNMFELSSRGILFSKEVVIQLKNRILNLNKITGFNSVLELMSILHDLSISKNMKMISDISYNEDNINYNNRKIEKAFKFMQLNYKTDMALNEVAKMVNMTDVSFSRFIKKHTGKTFIDSLNEIRLGHAARLLIDTTKSIGEISFDCGFNNISYFNRIFKKRKGCTPKSFRLNFAGTKTYV